MNKFLIDGQLRVEAIDIKPGTVYRRAIWDEWSTVESVQMLHGRNGIGGVRINDVGGGGCSVGPLYALHVKEMNGEG